MSPPWSSGNFKIKASGIGYLTVLLSTSSGYVALKIANCSLTSFAFSSFSRSAGVSMCSFFGGFFRVVSTLSVVYRAFSAPTNSCYKAFRVLSEPYFYTPFRPLSTVFSVHSDYFYFICSCCSNLICLCCTLKASFYSLRYFYSSSRFSLASYFASFSWIFFCSRSAAFWRDFSLSWRISLSLEIIWHSLHSQIFAGTISSSVHWRWYGFLQV
jgi:hypothetical protein